MGSGVGGVLYPPGSLAPEVLDEATFVALAPLADDIWLFWMERIAGSAIRRLGARYALRPWPGCHEQGLWVTENENGGNDWVIAALTAHYGWPHGHGMVRVSNEARGRERTGDTRDLSESMLAFLAIDIRASLQSQYKKLLARIWNNAICQI
jgi:hypothetical protein